jgi:hypothetical protein
MPMRSGLLSQAIALEQPITAGFIRYQLAAYDLTRGKSARNDVHWGPQTLWQHMWNFAGLHGLHATFHFADAPIAFSDTAKRERKVAAVEAREAVGALSAH